MLTLVMIVKNEASNIVDVLRSARPAIDAWCIMDTGSADDTKKLILETMVDMPGLLVDGPFVDFATTRNAVIELGQKHYPQSLLLMLSGTETLTDGAALREELQALDRYPSCHYIELRSGGTRFPQNRIFDPAQGWRYVGRYHEYLVGPGSDLAPGILSSCAIDYAGGEDKTESWKQALGLLVLDMQDRPADPRPVFYYAEVLRCLGREEEAYRFYRSRAEMRGGYYEEAYISCLYAGRIAAKLGRPLEEILELYFKAYDLCPHRAEALFELGFLFQQRACFSKAYLYACAADSKKPRIDSLFLEHDIYSWRAADLVATHAFRYGEHARGLDAAQRAASGNPLDQRIKDNLQWYLRHR